MRTGAARDHQGYFHETAFYGSDQSFVGIVAPFVLGGIEAGEPTIVACGDRNTKLLTEAIDCRDVIFMPGADQYARAATTIRDYRQIFSRYASTGVEQIRVIGDVPHPGLGADWTPWLHYEAAVNVAYDDFPIWGLCPYDERTAPAQVLHDVCCAHPFVATDGGGHAPNASFEAPDAFLEQRPDPFDDLGPPIVALTAPTASEARRAVAAVAARAVDDAGLERLRLITSELVTNAIEHGGEAVEMAVYVDEGSVTVSVHDDGAGPSDPLAGWCEPDPLRPGGRGLWIVNQVATDFRVSRVAGFEVRATVGHRG